MYKSFGVAVWAEPSDACVYKIIPFDTDDNLVRKSAASTETTLFMV